MDRVKLLRDALEAAEKALGNAVERYRLALGCCASCGDFFEVGGLAVATVDIKGRIQFEHDLCPDEPSNVRDSYRNPQQLAPSGESSI